MNVYFGKLLSIVSSLNFDRLQYQLVIIFEIEALTFYDYEYNNHW